MVISLQRTSSFATGRLPGSHGSLPHCIWQLVPGCFVCLRDSVKRMQVCALQHGCIASCNDGPTRIQAAHLRQPADHMHTQSPSPGLGHVLNHPRSAQPGRQAYAGAPGQSCKWLQRCKIGSECPDPHRCQVERRRSAVSVQLCSRHLGCASCRSQSIKCSKLSSCATAKPTVCYDSQCKQELTGL